VRSIAPKLALIDGQWRISGAKNPDGSPRAVEQGILTAVIKRTAQGWRILAWRENASATKITPFASAR
jgi:ketosteroid isomerase-like protein